jgi:hypothetical protein
MELTVIWLPVMEYLPVLRGTETADYIAQGIRVNDAGFFIELGDEYSNRLTNNWRLLNPEYCQACLKACQSAR